MHKFDIRVDVTDAVGTGEQLEVAGTVVVPDAGSTAPSLAMLAFPGGGYSRGYYDLQVGAGYSQAEHHAAQGIVFVAIDHLGVGGSSVPTKPLDYMAVARANTAASRWVVDRLRAGTLDPSLPAPVATSVAMGQSFGGFLLTLAEGTAPVADAVAMLGWSGIQTMPPWSPDVDLAAIVAGTAGNGLDHPMRKVFHAPDVPEAIVIADMTKQSGGRGSGAPWSTDHSPGGPALHDPVRGPLDRGAVADEAAAIRVPVFVGAGDIDVVPDVHAEAAAYPSSRDVTVCAFRDMAHMHNFASTRRVLWDRLAAWASCVGAGRQPTPAPPSTLSV